MPTGKVKFFDAKRGFGFIGGDDGVEVFLHASTLPRRAAASRPGIRVEYGVADGCKGPQTLTVRILSPTRSAPAARRREPQVMIPVIEDLVKLLDASSAALRNGKYPKSSWAIAEVLHAAADDFDA